MSAVDGGMSCRAAAACFGVGVSSAIRWRQQQLAKGDLRPGRPGGNVRSSAIDAHRVFLLSLVEEQSDLTLDEIREALAVRGTPVSIAAVWRFFDRHQITRKKVAPRHRAGAARYPEPALGLVRGPARS